jgi:hypothetical protein
MSTTPCHRLDCTRPADIKHLVGHDLVLLCARHWNTRAAS